MLQIQWSEDDYADPEKLYEKKLRRKALHIEKRHVERVRLDRPPEERRQQKTGHEEKQKCVKCGQIGADVVDECCDDCHRRFMDFRESLKTFDPMCADIQ